MQRITTVNRTFHCCSGRFVLTWVVEEIDSISGPEKFLIHAGGECMKISKEMFYAMIRGRKFRPDKAPESVFRFSGGLPHFDSYHKHYWEE